MPRRIATIYLYVFLLVVLAVPVLTLGLWGNYERRQDRSAQVQLQLEARARDVADEARLLLEVGQPARLQAQVEQNAHRAGARVRVLEGERVVADSLPGQPLAQQASARARVGPAQPEWVVEVSMAPAQFHAAVEAERRSILPVTLAATLVTLLITWLVGRVMKRDLSAFVAVTTRMGEGDFRPPSHDQAAILPKEIHEVWDALRRTLRLLDEGTRTRQALISELQKAGEQARWLSAGLRDVHDGFLVLDRDRRVVYVNAAWLGMRQVEREQLVGKLASEVASMEGVPRELLEDIEAKLRAHKPWWGTISHKRKDGSVRELELSISPVFDDHGGIEHYVELTRDVTERREAEAAMQQSERLASLGMLAAGMAHEINNPMTYVLSNLEHLKELSQESKLQVDPEEVDLELCLDDSIHGARRVVEIVADLQALSRQKVDSKVGKASALQTLEMCVRMAQGQIRHNAEVVREFPTEDVWLTINPQKLSQILLNLILNAVQAMAPGQAAVNRLTLRVRALSDGRGEISVADTGSGMPPGVAQRIFDPFFTTKGTGGGTGLGLSISHSIVTAAQGEILVESEVGKGTCFRVVLPLASAQEEASPPERTSLRGLSVLVVDDEPGVLTAIRRMLASCRTATATSVKQALEMIAHERFDLVLSDVMMSEHTGMELVQALRERDPEMARRVCLMSGGVIGAALVQEVRASGVPLLHKPMTSHELHEALRQVHQGRAAGEAET